MKGSENKLDEEQKWQTFKNHLFIIELRIIVKMDIMLYIKKLELENARIVIFGQST